MILVLLRRLLSRRRYRATYYTSGRWITVGRTFRTKRGVVRYLRLVDRNVKNCGVQVVTLPPRRDS